MSKEFHQELKEHWEKIRGSLKAWPIAQSYERTIQAYRTPSFGLDNEMCMGFCLAFLAQLEQTAGPNIPDSVFEMLGKISQAHYGLALRRGQGKIDDLKMVLPFQKRIEELKKINVKAYKEVDRNRGW